MKPLCTPASEHKFRLLGGHDDDDYEIFCSRCNLCIVYSSFGGFKDIEYAAKYLAAKYKGVWWEH